MTINIVIDLPQTTKWNPQAATGFMDAFLKRYSFNPEREYQEVSFGIHASSEGISWQIFATNEDNFYVISSLIHTYYPDAQVYEGMLPLPTFPSHKKTAMFYMPVHIPHLTPTVVSPQSYHGRDDPIIAVTNALNSLYEDEVVFYELRITNYLKHERSFLNKLLIGVLEYSLNRNNPFRYLQEPSKLQQLVDEKLEQNLTNAQFTITMLTPNKSRFHILDNVASAIAQASELGTLNSYISNVYSPKNEKDYFANNTPTNLASTSKQMFGRMFFALTASEAATIWHLPHDNLTASNIIWSDRDETCLPVTLQDIEGIPIGTSCDVEVRLPLEDRTAHTMIVGKSGTGKTSLMHRMIHEDIAAGRGVCVIDPQGNLIPQILSASIPSKRIDDVVVIDPSMTFNGKRYPPPINPLFKVDGEVSMLFLGLIERIYGEFAGTRMEYFLRLAMRTLSGEENPTLLSVRKLFRDPEYQRQLLKNVDSISLAKQWDDFTSETSKQQDQMTYPMFRKLDPFYDNNEALAITCHPNQLNFYELVQDNKIILVSLGSKGNKIDDNVRLILGSCVFAQIEAVARAGAIKDKSKPFLLYVDETQNFIHTPIDKLLAELRQHGLGLILVNQYLRQLTGDVQQSIEGNFGTMFSFEIGYSDARAMQHYMTTFDVDALTSLGKYKAATSMRYNNDRQPSFLLETFPPIGQGIGEERAKKRESFIRHGSVDNYTPKSYDEVINWVREQYDADSVQSPDNDEDKGDFTYEKR